MGIQCKNVYRSRTDLYLRGYVIMIGQAQLLKQIDQLIMDMDLPRFTIIIGPAGSGKKLLASYICDTIGYTSVCCENKVEEVRNIIELSYKQNQPTIYYYPNADGMSIASKNALLKVTEESPQNSYFIMCISSDTKTLPTILSRGQRFYMQPYSYMELYTYAKDAQKLKEKEAKIAAEVCNNPGQINTLSENSITEFYKFAESIVENIGQTELFNILKVTKKFKLGNKTEGWDLGLFIQLIQYICVKKYKETKNVIYYKAINECCLNYSQELNINGINTSMLLDSFLLKLGDILYLI